MDALFFWIGNLMVVTGIALLAAATVKVTALLRRLPNRALQYHWQGLRVLILLFICGYAGYSLLHWDTYVDGSSMIVPTIFLGGALFVLWVCTLSLRTTKVVQTVYHLQKEAITDPLMKIFNRRYLDRRLQEEVLICRTGNRPLTLMMLDIDHFKLVNDRYGHPVGDEVLKALGQLLMRHTRHADVVARYGGEEVVVLLPNTCGNEAHALARRLHKEVAQLSIALPELNQQPRPPLTFSVCIGVAGCNASNADASQLLAAADMALYQAKQNGRNRVECCPDLRLAANATHTG